MATQELKNRLRNALREPKFSQELVNLIERTTGSIFYVDSVDGSASNTGKASDEALITLDAAIGKCTASKGDIIVLMPKHAETISAASAIDFDVVGITVIGLGEGTDRPTITLDNTAATIVIDAANTKIKNVHFINTVDALVVAFDVNAAHFTIESCIFDDATAAEQTIVWFICDANADYFTVRDCTHHGSDTAGSTAWITLNGNDHVVIEGCTSHGDFSAANIRVVTAACTDLLITKNHLENANAVDVCIELYSAVTGWVSYNSIRIATDGQLTGINTPGNTGLFENYQVNNNGETGVLVGTASS
jgi:hypothetical protein